MKKMMTFALVALLAVGMPLLAYAVPTASAQDGFSNPNEFSGAAGGGGGGLHPVSDKIDAGSLGIGGTAQVIVRFTNGDPQDIKMTDIKLFPSSNVAVEISTDECSKVPLPSGAECALVLSVKSLQRGPFRIEMLVSHTGRTRLVTATINGSVDVPEGDKGAAGQEIQIDPSPIDFGTLEASRSLIRSVTLRNTTSNSIDISQMRVDASEQSGYELRSDCKTLLAGQACIASVIWSPRVSGPSSGFLVINHSGSTRLATAAISGTFTPTAPEQAKIFPSAIPGKGLLVSSETSIDFGTISSEASITVSLVNTGDANLKIVDIATTNNQQGLKIQDNGCKKGTELKPTDACPLILTWTPVRAGSILDDIRISHDGARGVLVIPIRGSATDVQSLDARPMMVVGDQTLPVSHATRQVGADTGDAASEDVTSSPTRDSSVQGGVLEKARLLESYKITSMSKDRAVIQGPGGSKIVRNASTIRLAGVVWNTTVTAEGVQMQSGRDRLMLVFDRSFTTMETDMSKSSAATSSDASVGAPPESSTPSLAPSLTPLVPAATNLTPAAAQPAAAAATTTP